MSNIYKIIIGVCVGLMIFIVYTVKKDVGVADGSDVVVFDRQDKSLQDNPTVPRINEDDAKKVLDELKLTNDDLVNLNNTNEYLKSRTKLERLSAQSSWPIAPKEFETLMKEIDWMTENKYVFLFEAYQTKLFFLGKQYKNDQLKEKINELEVQMLAKDAEARKMSESNVDPSEIEYKQKVARVIAEADRMTIFPNGMSRADYLNEQIKKIR